MKLQTLLAIFGIGVGAIVLFIYPQLLDFTLKYSILLQSEVDPSLVRGTPVTIATGTIPLLFGLFGFLIGYLLNKIIKKS